jgi:hypothetical protein
MPAGRTRRRRYPSPGTSSRNGRIEDQATEIKRVRSQPSGRGSAEYLTGTVRVDPLFQAPAPAHVSGAAVALEPGYGATFGHYTVNDGDANVHVARRRRARPHPRRQGPAAYTFTGNQWTIEPANKDEHWRVVWARESARRDGVRSSVWQRPRAIGRWSRSSGCTKRLCLRICAPCRNGRKRSSAG